MNSHRTADVSPLCSRDWPDLISMFNQEFSHDIYYPFMRNKLHIARTIHPIGTKRILGEVFLLRVQNVPAGFIILKQVGNDEIHLHYMAVAERYRRQGFGRTLVQFACQEAKRRGCVLSLETTEGTPAAELYRSMGFSIEQEIHAYIWNGSCQGGLNDGALWKRFATARLSCSLSELMGRDLGEIPLRRKSWLKMPGVYIKEKMLDHRDSIIVAAADEKIFAAFRFAEYQRRAHMFAHFRTASVDRALLVQTLMQLPTQSGKMVPGFRLIDFGQTDPHILADAGYSPGDTYIGMNYKDI